MRQDAQLRREIDPHCLSRLLMQIEIDPESGCWGVRGRKPRRYLRMWVGNERIGVHRYVYECFVGTIPYGLVIDHLCCNRGCLNPLHLEATTVAENSRRAVRLRHKTRTHCAHGHPLSGQNLLLARDRGGNVHRRCRTCGVMRTRAYRERQRQLLKPRAANFIGAMEDYEAAG